MSVAKQKRHYGRVEGKQTLKHTGMNTLKTFSPSLKAKGIRHTPPSRASNLGGYLHPPKKKR